MTVMASLIQLMLKIYLNKKKSKGTFKKTL